MSEDRLEKALEGIKSEAVNPEDLARARERVWEKLGNADSSLCIEFQAEFRNYLDGNPATSGLAASPAAPSPPAWRGAAVP